MFDNSLVRSHLTSIGGLARQIRCSETDKKKQTPPLLCSTGGRVDGYPYPARRGMLATEGS